jgi:ABC-type nitrate/sulfonate/bicarbonate transport system permease component
MVLVVLCLWQLAAVTNVAGRGSVPTPTSIVAKLWEDRSLYPDNIRTTLGEAIPGFFWGSLFAIVLGVVFAQFRVVERLFSGTTVAILCLPLIAVAPILVIVFTDYVAKVSLAALAVFFPVLVGTVVGMRSSDPSVLDVIRGCGGSGWTAMRMVRFRSALPSIFAALRVAAPAAVLGAILGEFVGGTSGLGVFMMNSLAQFERPRTWAVGLVATLLGTLGYALVWWIGQRVCGSEPLPLVTQAMARPPRRRGGAVGVSGAAVGVVLSVAVAISCWALFIQAFQLDSFFAKSPTDVARFFVADPNAAGYDRHTVISALFATLPAAALGVIAGVSAAFVAAIVFVRSRTLEALLMPGAMVFQSVPLQALSPLIVVVLGRGLSSLVLVSVLVTFFPSVVLMTFGLRNVSPQALDVMASLRASEWTVLRKLRVPAAVPSLFAAARIAAPRALLGVLVAEYIATGRGIGYLLLRSKQQSQWILVWAAAVLITGICVAVYAVVGQFEKRALRRYAPGHLAT